ncbi:NAD(P)/FAD-dependent oxidoreductase, partial [methane-oxidizing endosymbiont of Gigantopelta aegis]|uniref:NAD(P)/FAD-dependent oxidoreductase n=1 Tax=methane-oxidizing endosymbiont of Gigantopelta aegis TaxID=2794938 RepID=UPI0018DE9D31
TEKQLRLARYFYRQLAQFFGQPFFIEKPMLRLLSDEKERKIAEKRCHDPQYQRFLSSIQMHYAGLHSPFGFLQQQQTAYLTTVPLLANLRQWFKQQGALINSRFNPTALNLSTPLKWRGQTVKRLIFCQGHENLENPWFNYLPLKPVKGEILTAFSPVPLIDTLLNYGHWFIPLDNQHFKTGASFDRETRDTHTTAIVKNQLLASLKRVYPAAATKAEIHQHQAGIRPTTADRKPFIGHHPVHKNLYIFNGFGAKGSLQIPYYSQFFIRHLLHNTPLPPDCDIRRYD